MSLFDLFSNNAQLNAANTIRGGIAQGEQQALPYYQGGIANLQAYGQSALAPLQQNYGALSGGVNQLGNVLGLNGPAGSQQALQTLQNTPGYQFSLQQGNNAINAQNAATGGTGSGNEALALNKFGQGLASTTYNNYVSQLQPYLTGAQNTAGQIANTNMGIGAGVQGGLNNIGNMYYGGATSGANALAAAQSNLSGPANLLNFGLAGLSGLGGLGSNLMSLSDIKLKEDVEPVGALADGQTVYRYHYKGSPRTELGLIAQEVENFEPSSVIEFLPDLRAVDYRRATERAAKILELSRQRGEPTPTHRPFASELMGLAA